MPTPFFHLNFALDLLKHPALSTQARTFLLKRRCAFLLGNTAPDVQVVSGQERTATHFFGLPIQPGDTPPWEKLLAVYPALREPQQLNPQQGAFLAGYLCHLRADWDWVLEIFLPAFGPRCTWGTFRQRLYYHNVLRAYLDQRLLPTLRGSLEGCLVAVDPDGWLPFVAGQHLRTWRDLLAPQFHPDAIAQTVEVFASRQGIPSAEYYALLSSEARMQAEVFVHIPAEQIERYQQRLLTECIQLVETYLATGKPAYPAKIIQTAAAVASTSPVKEKLP